MTEKEKDENITDDVLGPIFANYDFGSYTVDVSTMATDTNTSTFTWDASDANIDHVFTGTDWSTITTNTVNSTIDFKDPYAELEEFREEKEKEEELRKEYPSLQEVYDEYLLVKKLVEENEFDKTFEKRYEGFGKK